jgi:hypothetical protein
MIYELSLNHKGNRAIFKDFLGCSVIVFKVSDGFHFHHLKGSPLLWRFTSDSFLQYVLRYLGTLTPIPSKCVKINLKNNLAIALPSMILDYLLN